MFLDLPSSATHTYIKYLQNRFALTLYYSVYFYIYIIQDICLARRWEATDPHSDLNKKDGSRKKANLSKDALTAQPKKGRTQGQQAV